jgi:TonB family protein
MGRVYHAFDPLAQRAVAIKTVRAEYCSGPEAEEYLARFRREAQAAAGLSHPNIVTVFDVGEDYFVMELLEGTTLDTVLRGHPRLSVSATIGILGPIAEAMDLAHSKGIIHRDIKPANIFLLRDGRPKIMDFGVAHLRAAAMTSSGTLWGSPSYMAPEQIANSRASESTDVFSLGIVAYEMLSGRKPFEGENITEVLYRVVHTDPSPVSAWAPELPKFHDDVFRRALAKDPSARFQTASALVAALGRPGAEGTAEGATFTAAPVNPSATRALSSADVETQELGLGPRSRSRSTDKAPAATDKSVRRRVRWALELVGAAAAVVVVLLAAGVKVPWGPRAAAVELMSEPANATARVDGKVVGKTPVVLRGLTPGAHTVQVDLPGYAPAEMALELDAGSLPAPIRFVLHPTEGTLRIRSEPSGATVRLDGKVAGTTPTSALAAAAGTHEVTVDAKGYRPWSQTVLVAAGNDLSLNPTLTPTLSASPRRLQDLGWVREGSLERLGPGVTPPRRISGEPAPYPSAAKKLKLGGTVVVEFTVTETGETRDVGVVKSGGAPLDAQMTATVLTWRYTPAERNGVKVRVRIRAEQQFRYKS